MADIDAIHSDGPRTSGARSGGSRTVQSVERAFDVLEFLSDAGREIQLRELADATGLNISTCHHLVSTLVKRGYAVQNPRGRTYFLGTKILEIANSRLSRIDLVELAMPELRDLNETTREAVHLAVLQGYDLTTIAKLESSHPVRVATDGVGKSNAAHATATGKAILAWLPEREIRRVIDEKGLTAFTPNTITTVSGLMEDLRHVRRNGYAVEREEFQPGVVCLGGAIRNHTGAVIGSLSCSMPESRATDEQLEKIRQAVRTTATNISESLGSPEETQPPHSDAA